MEISNSKQQVHVLLAAAGSGSRMQSRANKQFLEIKGLPTIIRTARVFDALAQVTSIKIITALSELEEMKLLFSRHVFHKKITFCPGGVTRQHSVYNGLKDLAREIGQQAKSIVLVHDGARCLISEPVIMRCLLSIEKTGIACAAAVPVKDTIKRVQVDQTNVKNTKGQTESGQSSTSKQIESEQMNAKRQTPKIIRVEKTLDRSLLWAVQTPQGAYFTQLLAAYRQAMHEQLELTDDLAVMEAAGSPTGLSLGDYQNIKITTPEDLVLAESFLSDKD